MKTATATLSQLKLNPEINPRHIDAKADVSDIKAQIRHKGCIGQLWVRAIKGAKFEIIDGGRRYRAMLELAKDGELKKDAKIPVNIFVAGDAEAQDLALSANFPREALSPADEAIGFTRLRVSGMEVADIAAHYAVTPRLVQQRIAIGSLPKPILEALREGEIDIGTAQLFTAAPAERALKLFKDLAKKKALSSYQVRKALEDGSISGDDRRCVFVGASAYEAAGGVISRDLFSDHESWNDPQLLDTLFEEKIAAQAQALKDEGWSFVEVMRKNTYLLSSWGKSVSKETRELSKDEKAELKNLKAEHKAFDDEYEVLEQKSAEDELSDSEQERIDALPDLLDTRDARIAELEAPVFTPRQMAKAGCVIKVNEHGGTVEILRGMLKPGTKGKSNGKSAGDDEENGGEGVTYHTSTLPSEGADYSDALTTLLESVAQKSTKLAMVMNKPSLTYRMGLAARILAAIDDFGHEAPFDVAHKATESGAAYEILRAAEFQQFGIAEENADDVELSHQAIVAKLEQLQPVEIIKIEAFLAADLFEVTSLKNTDVQAVIAAIDPDMSAEGFKPDLEFMARLNRAQLLQVISECEPSFKTPASWKKAEIVDEASVRAQATGWLPPPLRTPSYKGPGSNAWSDVLAAKSAEAIAEQQAAE